MNGRAGDSSPKEISPQTSDLNPASRLPPTDLDALGEDFEKTSKGLIDFLLLDDNGFPLIVLEAKSEDKNPLTAKEQARRYARSLNCRFVILSNGNLHYFWDLDQGNPHVITEFPDPDSVGQYQQFTPSPERLTDERVEADYIALTQRPGYASEAAWRNEDERAGFIRAQGLRFLRDYQVRAVHALQDAVSEGQWPLSVRDGDRHGQDARFSRDNQALPAHRQRAPVLFLVDRLELENQAEKVFKELLSNDFDTVIYKERRDDWRAAEIVISTVQSLMFNNKYQSLFSPTDFDLVISDEAHRSISGNARSVFEHFVGYKLGLTATPRDYLRGFSRSGPNVRDPREADRRILLDTYRTFGCESGQPTFRYSLLDGVKDGYLINPTVVDARTEVTTQLLADEGFVATFIDDTGDEHEETYKQREFERRFFSEATNQVFCKTFLRERAARPGQRRNREIHHIRREPEPRRQAYADPQRDGRRHVPAQVPVRLRRTGHLPGPERPAVHHQLRQQQPHGFRQLPRSPIAPARRESA